MRKGSEQLHMFDSRAHTLAAKTRQPQFQQFEAEADEYGIEVPVARRRLYSHYERVPTDMSADPRTRTDDYLVKYKTEICKNFEFIGACRWGDAVN